MSSADFNRDGHPSLPEVMYAYGMLEDSDAGNKNAQKDEVTHSGGSCLVMIALTFLLPILFTLFCYSAGYGN